MLKQFKNIKNNIKLKKLNFLKAQRLQILPKFFF